MVESEGFPNLLHEFVHIVLYGRLEDDHGIDYQAIPFDLRTAAGREVLFDELACALWSCEWMLGSDYDRQAWFAEQLSIQPVFYGYEESDLPAFLVAVAEQVDRHPDQLRAVLQRAQQQAIAWVGDAVLPAHPALPDVHARFARLLADS